MNTLFSVNSSLLEQHYGGTRSITNPTQTVHKRGPSVFVSSGIIMFALIQV